MDTLLLSEEIQNFINASLNENVSQLALKKNPFPEVAWTTILNQIAAKQKAQTKLPTWFTTKNILYPTKISLEQTSSEATAAYKANLITGDSLLDATGGFGVDDYYFAKKINEVIHCEVNKELAELVQHNLNELNIKNIQCISGDSSEILSQLNQKFDWIYLDPSRRNDAKGKVFMLKDCQPNVPELLDFYFGFSDNIMIKTAPILDLAAGISELRNVAEIHIVALDNEVKELLWMLKKNHNLSTYITTCNILKNNVQNFSFSINDSTPSLPYSLPKKYLYEPNAALMKSGGFEVISNRFGIAKLHQHSHLYTSNSIHDFPGRIFEIKQSIGYSKMEMKQFLVNTKANITTRNFPDSVEQIRQKWKIKEGGSLYCFFTTNATNEKIVLLCHKIS
jgi:hypothetical protein